MQAKRERIVIVAGRSGGHIIPGITLAQQYKHDHPDAEILFFSTNNPLDQAILNNQPDIDRHKTVSIGNVPRHFYRYPVFTAKIFGVCIMCILQFLCKRPTKIILMGGYVSIPVALAAWALRIPRELYELNAIPGKAAKFLAPFSSRICLCFVQTKRFFNPAKSIVVPYPVRFNTESRSLSQLAAQNQLNLDQSRKTILILGGSQGSLFINNVIKASLLASASIISHIQIIHQTGAQDSTDWANWYKQRGIPAIVFPYHHDLSLHYQAADLIIGRAGAGTIFEILFFQKQALLIPLENTANDHQLHNALAIQQSYSTLITVARQPDLEKNKQLIALAFTNLCTQTPLDCTTKQADIRAV